MPQYKPFPRSPTGVTRHRFELIVERGAADRAARAYEEAQRAATARIERHIKPGTPITPATGRALKQRFAQAQIEVARETLHEMTEAIADVHKASLSTLDILHHEATKQGRSPLEVAAVREEIIAARASTSEAVAKQYMAKWASESAVRIAQHVEDAQRILAPSRELFEALELNADSERYRVYRIARTEASYAYNVVQQEGIERLAQEHKGLQKRWVERVSDTTGQPMDNRVANDSIAMHAQITDPDGVFTMPVVNNVTSVLWGQAWMFPPNRPMDRAIVMPHFANSKEPAWVFRNGEKHWLKRYG